MNCSRSRRRAWRSVDQIRFEAGQNGRQFAVAQLCRKNPSLRDRTRTEIRAPAGRQSQPASLEQKDPARDYEPGQYEPKHSGDGVFARRCSGDLAAANDLRCFCRQVSPLAKSCSRAVIDLRPVEKFLQYAFGPCVGVKSRGSPSGDAKADLANPNPVAVITSGAPISGTWFESCGRATPATMF
jgi:hypothetical protein